MFSAEVRKTFGRNDNGLCQFLGKEDGQDGSLEFPSSSTFSVIVKMDKKTIYLLTEFHPGASYGCCSYHLSKQFHRFTRTHFSVFWELSNLRRNSWWKKKKNLALGDYAFYFSWSSKHIHLSAHFRAAFEIQISSHMLLAMKQLWTSLILL